MIRSLKNKNFEQVRQLAGKTTGKITFVTPRSMRLVSPDIKRYLIKTLNYKNLEVVDVDSLDNSSHSSPSFVVPLVASFSILRLVRGNGFYHGVFGSRDSAILMAGVAKAPGFHLDIAFGESLPSVPSQRTPALLNQVSTSLEGLMGALRPDVFPDVGEFSKKLPKPVQRSAKKIANNSAFPAMLFFERMMTLAMKTIFSGLELRNEEVLNQLPKNSMVIYVTSHRSHLDYLALPLALHRVGQSIPLVTAGQNLDFFPVGGLLKRGIAFFIKRKFDESDPFWIAFKKYLEEAFIKRTNLCFFLNGRSRNGRTTVPKAGLLKMVMEAQANVNINFPVYYIPVQITYDRLPEITGLAAMRNGEKKKKETAFGLLKSLQKISLHNGITTISLGKPFQVQDLQLGNPSHPLCIEMNYHSHFSVGALLSAYRLIYQRKPNAVGLEKFIKLCTLIKEKFDTKWSFPGQAPDRWAHYQKIVPEAFETELSSHSKAVLEILKGQMDQVAVVVEFALIAKKLKMDRDSTEALRSSLVEKWDAFWDENPEARFLWEPHWTADRMADLVLELIAEV